MYKELLEWIIPVALSFALLTFTFILFPRILVKILPDDVKSLHPVKRFLLGAAIIIVVVFLLFAICFTAVVIM